ncbi:hypothetical protein [Alistipes sp.]|uniref:hypothetical protein n=1 Tax=Alistipes sp. TaxID=1872444 RepID=UPI003AEF8E8D
MRLTQEEFAIAARWETNMQTAIRSRYLRNVGRTALERLVSIYERISGERRHINPNCAACVAELLQRLGAVYFADKAERERANAEPGRAEPGRERAEEEQR